MGTLLSLYESYHMSHMFLLQLDEIQSEPLGACPNKRSVYTFGPYLFQSRPKMDGPGNGLVQKALTERSFGHKF